jgi:hypothetical protein
MVQPSWPAASVAVSGGVAEAVTCGVGVAAGDAAALGALPPLAVVVAVGDSPVPSRGGGCVACGPSPLKLLRLQASASDSNNSVNGKARRMEEIPHLPILAACIIFNSGQSDTQSHFLAPISSTFRLRHAPRLPLLVGALSQTARHPIF